jgi:hypothetical protein
LEEAAHVYKEVAAPFE